MVVVSFRLGQEDSHAQEGKITHQRVLTVSTVCGNGTAGAGGKVSRFFDGCRPIPVLRVNRWGLI